VALSENNLVRFIAYSPVQKELSLDNNGPRKNKMTHLLTLSSFRGAHAGRVRSPEVE